ncbi:GLUT4 regulating protein TUG-domain-containing protein [Dactylonectria estremocensis]|uniref:GLUT4 regulating protein TUG-domain-containing protein n=1 Tax=Dactylonectria estremocensis TaxID=1079267 RepID=A0A9P9EHF1_9HYPO|nr:GLUT4 regulating protein TUG-domain-containing protein [Dactylonectria estremocensis]
MASHVVVIATDLRRTTIKVNPGTYLTDVLQEACKKLNLSSDRYLIKHRQKQVDLSVPFRTSGLIPGAKLELVQKSNTPSAIQVALQVPPPEGREIPGGRLIQKFPSDLTLWKVLRQFESGQASNGKNVNITARGVAQTASSSGSGGGQLYYEIPVLNIMGRELASFADFQRTLSQLGYNSGSVLIRLAYRKTDRTLFDAMAEIGQFFSEEEEAASAAPEPVKKEATEPAEETQDTLMEEAQPNTIEESSHDQQPEQDGTLGPSNDQVTKKDDLALDSSQPTNSLEPVGVFLAPSGTVPAAALAAVEESDYTPSIAHAQIHQARLQQNSRNTRLLSDKELEDKAAIENARVAAIKSVLVKVRFPDNTSSDWQVGPAETGRFLYDAVRHVMVNDDQPFHLVLPGTTAVIKDADGPSDSLIKGYKLSGRVLVNLVWDNGVPPAVRKQPFLKSNVARQGQQVKVPEPIVDSDDKGKGSELPTLQPSHKGEGSGDKLGKKIPKWLKLGKK